AAKALQEGKFNDEIVPVEVTLRKVDENNKLREQKLMFSQDEGVRPGTTADVLGKLRPAFSVKGSVTAGNSSQTSDGAASVFLMDKEQAEAEGLKPLLKFRSF
ncbi:acetyl-CoA C-acyltransferase, partial [Bacillus subtilis]|nr:acetyl-CoA C-acyltransferase [Bacillus subtilis]